MKELHQYRIAYLRELLGFGYCAPREHLPGILAECDHGE